MRSLILALAALAHASLRQVQVAVSPAKIKVDDQFKVEFVVPSQCTLEEPSGNADYQVVARKSHKRQNLHLLKNGYSSTSFQRQSSAYDVDLTMILQALRPGTLAIGPFSVHCGDVDLETPARTIEVEGGAPVVAAPPPAAPKEERIPSTFVGIQNIPPAAAPAPKTDDQDVQISLLRTTPPAAAPKDEKPREEAARPKGAEPAPPPPDNRRGLIYGAAGLGGAIILVLLWSLVKAKVGGGARKPFARAPLPEVAIHRDEDVIGGKYKLQQEVGAGGMGLVYKAWDLKLQRPVAVKKMRSELQFNQEQRANFMREAMIISKLSHPYIVAIHEVIEQAGDLYLVFDYVDGRPLSAIIDKEKPLSLKRCQEVFSHVCQAIDFAHKNNVLHQDLKPSNIMVDSNGFAKVMDFGLAREAKVATNETWGTFAYMAPERHMGAGTASADIYSLGVCVYEMLAGRLPFPGPDYEMQKEGMSYVALTKLRPDLPKGIDGFIAAALAPSPKDRIPAALDFLDKLKAL